VLGASIDASGRPLLDDAAFVHDDDAIAGRRGDAQVMGDEEQAEAELLLDVAQQLHDLGLHADVERAGGFVSHQRGGPAGERAGDRQALPLAAAKLMAPSTIESPAVRAEDYRL
jgi:hypothetical protein